MRMSRVPTGLVLAGPLLVAGCVTPGTDPHWQARADAVRAEVGAPALGLVVMRPGAAPVVAVAGTRVAGGAAAAAPADRWHWGSISKSMTATLVARLVEKGVVKWDDTVGRSLGAAVPEMRDAYRAATFRHLLSHRAGLQPNIPLQRFADFGQAPPDPAADRLKWVKIALAQDPAGPLGETYLYSNNGFVVAGAMLEAATGESWERLMQREVFAPLGLRSAGFGAPAGPAPDSQPRGHSAAEGGPRPAGPAADNPAALGPAGRVHMSLADLAGYLSAHVRRDPRFLSEQSYAMLHGKPFGGTYALGWVVPNDHTGWHNGSNTLWYAEAAFDRATGTVAAVVVNDGDIERVEPGVSTLLGELLKGR